MPFNHTFRVFLFFFFFRETFQNVKDTTARLKAMNKKMVDLTKQGGATETLEAYVPLTFQHSFRKTPELKTNKQPQLINNI